MVRTSVVIAVFGILLVCPDLAGAFAMEGSLDDPCCVWTNLEFNCTFPDPILSCLPLLALPNHLRGVLPGGLG